MGLKDIDLKEKYAIQKTVEKLILEWRILSLKRGTKVALFLLKKHTERVLFFNNAWGV